jgi:hypothetical protein
MKKSVTKAARPRSSSSVKMLPPRRDPRGGMSTLPAKGAPSKLAANRNEVMVAAARG